MQVDATEFLAAVLPALEAGDARRLAQAVRYRWKPRQICSLLRNADPDVRRVAAMALGFVGDRSSVEFLTRALHDEDKQVNQMAEHGLWSIWFRSGDAKASQPFSQGVAMLSAECYVAAVDSFRRAIAIDPEFAEAYNQCAIAHFFLSDWREAINDCDQTLALMPAHFGAMSGMGHSFVHLGELDKAFLCYRKALAINPRMLAIARAIQRLEAKVQNSSKAPSQSSQI